MQKSQERPRSRAVLLSVFSVLLALIAVILFACGDSSETQTDNQNAEANDSEATVIVTGKLADYTIVRADNSGNPILKQVLNLRGRVRDKNKIELPYGTDFTQDKGQPEILIGMTNRKESIEVARELTESTRFILRAVNNKLVILSNTQKGLAEAISYLSDVYLTTQSQLDDITQIDHTELSTDVILMNKDHSFQFVLPNKCSSGFSECASLLIQSYNIPEFSLVKQARFNANHSVCIGAVEEDSLSMSYANIVNQDEYTARVAKNNVYLQAENELLTLIALDNFLSAVKERIDYDFEGNLCVTLPESFYVTKTWTHPIPMLCLGNLDNSEELDDFTHIFYYSDVTGDAYSLFKKQLSYFGFTADAVVSNYYYQNGTGVALNYSSGDRTLSITLTYADGSDYLS